ncbi:protein kinase [Sphingomonas panacisoli]|uniref:Protein kinase n=1 Tax=Sphingomonas panacisoli TaxID=1813879 RepID=A0A5B8LMF7_9SPHN|nr:serine/threonine-protein kinase [Sphingomonas panacisoli]QDZ08774.1 protein kinase [Sphingomonas panacisoli]
MIACPNCKAENPDGSSFCQHCGKPLAGQATGSGPIDLSSLNTISGDETKPRGYKQSEDTALEPGTVFAERYTIESIIGRGGMGIVYRAKDSIGDRAVALKLIRSDVVGGDAAIKRLISEGVLTQDIRHKNVVSVYNVGQQDDQPFVSMEFVNGVSLREWLRQQVTARTEVPLRVAARIIAEILDGLDAAHSMGIVHRDLKPENVMLTADPSPTAAPLKILDFGIARAANKIESGTGTGLGTPRYMAPEQITNPDAAGPSADIYSVSVMFYELLVDVLPQGHWQPPSGGRSDVSPAVDSLIERGLSNRPASRPQTAKDYRGELVAAVNNTAPASPPRPTPPPPPPGAVNSLYTSDGNKAPQVDWSNPLKQPVVKWTAIGCGTLIFLFMVLVMIFAIKDAAKKVPETGPSPSSSSSESEAGVAALNGLWREANGGRYQITVESNGMFSGSGNAGDGSPASVNGQFDGVTGRAQFSIAGYVYPGTLVWDGKCNVSYVLYGPDRQARFTGMMHVTNDTVCP